MWHFKDWKWFLGTKGPFTKRKASKVLKKECLRRIKRVCEKSTGDLKDKRILFELRKIARKINSSSMKYSDCFEFENQAKHILRNCLYDLMYDDGGYLKIIEGKPKHEVLVPEPGYVGSAE
jgi:hypothetical protein